MMPQIFKCERCGWQTDRIGERHDCRSPTPPRDQTTARSAAGCKRATRDQRDQGDEMTPDEMGDEYARQIPIPENVSKAMRAASIAFREGFERAAAKYKGLMKDHEDDWKRIQDAERECERLNDAIDTLRAAYADRGAAMRDTGDMVRSLYIPKVQKLEARLIELELVLVKMPCWPDREGEGSPHVCFKCEALGGLK